VNDKTAERPVRDRVGEALRRWTVGALRPLWADAAESKREEWRGFADQFIRIAANCGVKIERSDG
jgi:hypothetical protein